MLSFVLILSKSGRKYSRKADSLAIAHRLAQLAGKAGYSVVSVIPA